MSSMRFRFIFRSFGVVRLWNVWYRNNLVHSVVRKCRERCVREVFQCFKYAIRPRRTLLLSVTATFRNRDGDEDTTFSCEQGITDDELEALLSELQNVEQLAKMTLYCTSCGKRLVIDRKQSGVSYCMCKEPQTEECPDGWVPFMEAEDVIIWRKEYKPGQGLYAYKVYGRYPEVSARDFAAVQIDGAYRRAWDAAVAALAVVQQRVGDIPGQAVLHWEVLWPRLFANRDYVYIRRHKEFDTMTSQPAGKRLPIYDETTSVHAKAKRKAMETHEQEQDSDSVRNKVFVIISRSCEHPDAPQTKHAVRVHEYWSHMVVRTLDGEDKPGMDFVLTYYDEPEMGGMPGGVAAWASGRAAPAYLQRMRRAAGDYRRWLADNHQDLPDFTPFEPDQLGSADPVAFSEQDMESSHDGPESAAESTKDQSTQTDLDTSNVNDATIKTDESSTTSELSIVKNDKEEEREVIEVKVTVNDEVNESEKEEVIEVEKEEVKEAEKEEVKEAVKEEVKEAVKEEPKEAEKEEVKEADNGKEKEEVNSKDTTEVERKDETEYKQEGDQAQEGDSDKTEETSNGSWWRYLYPFYYFV